MEFRERIEGLSLEWGTEKVMDTKQGSLETKMGRGGVMIRVLVQGYTECNTRSLT